MKLDELGDWRRTHYTADVTPELDGKEVVVLGWVQDMRDLGGLRFIILQDREGTVQITIPRKKVSPQIVEKTDELGRQYSIGVKGVVKGTKMTPRGVEIIPDEIRVLSVAQQPLPLDITGKTPSKIDARLDARVLDLSMEDNRAAFRTLPNSSTGTR